MKIGKKPSPKQRRNHIEEKKNSVKLGNAVFVRSRPSKTQKSSSVKTVSTGLLPLKSDNSKFNLTK